MSLYRSWGKRALDLALVVSTSPIWLVLGALTWSGVRLWIGSPVLFTQRRPGLGGRIFTLRKFRTMTDGRDDAGNLLPDDDRVTPFGEWLRATSLDEIPTLWNVLAGDMSLVGPRPLRLEYLPRYNARQARRHDVRPGVTGLAQVNGRNLTTWEQKFEYDVQYVEQYSFPMDLRILLKTIGVVWKGQGASPDGRATMEEFRGS